MQLLTRKRTRLSFPAILNAKRLGMFLYSAVSNPLDRSKRFTLFSLPDRPVHSDTNSASPGGILVMQQLRATTKSLTFPPLSIAFHPKDTEIHNLYNKGKTRNFVFDGIILADFGSTRRFVDLLRWTKTASWSCQTSL